MGGVGQEPARVLNFWQAVEIFNPQPLPSVNPVKNVYEVNDGLLPWDAGHPLRRIKIKDNLTWRHCVYVGVFDIQRVRELLQEKFGSDPESFDDRPSGQTALLAFMVTDEGEPLLGSEEFASCAWAAGRLRNPGPENPGWLTGFEAACEGCRRELGEITAAEYLATTEDELGTPELSPREYEVGSRLDFQDLLRFADEVARQFAVEEVLSPAGFRVASLKVSKRKLRAADGGEMLTSLFAADLAAVAEAVGQGEIGAALHAYLQGPGQAADRIDVLKQPRVVDEGVAPSFTPAGRWPARASQSLAYSQQFAANTIMRGLARGSGLYAVNGPPGTGKTTMLRELIAAIVVERAMRLADLAKPSDAFDRCFHWKTGGYSRTVSALKESLTGFEIVVASSNNGAVENISLEVPGLKAIASDDWSEPVDYYRELATHMLSSAESMRRDDFTPTFPARRPERAVWPKRDGPSVA